jgi:hypothetical protein
VLVLQTSPFLSAITPTRSALTRTTRARLRRTERRLRDKSHLKFVAMQVFPRRPRAFPSASLDVLPAPRLAKVSDEFTVPLCGCTMISPLRSEREWWENHHISPEPIAAEFWARTRIPAMGMEPAASNVAVRS